MAYRYMTVGWGAVASQPVTPECCDDHWNPPKRKLEKRGGEGDASFKGYIDGGLTGRFGSLTASGVCMFFDELFVIIAKRGVLDGHLIGFGNGADYVDDIDCVCLLLAACIWPIWPKFSAITAVFAYWLNAANVSSKTTITTTTGLESAEFKLFGEKKKGTIKHV